MPLSDTGATRDHAPVGRTAFTRAEIDAIKRLLQAIRRADRDTQKTLRGRLRRQFDFYISDFSSDSQGFVASDVDQLVRRGVITVLDDPGESPPQQPVDGMQGRPSPVARTSIDGSRGAPLPPSFMREGVEGVGFVGWLTWNELRRGAFADVPAEAGCYVVYRTAVEPPAFVESSPGGHFKGRDPSVAAAVLADAWVPGAHTVYIGKGEMLRPRLRQYARFGAGEPVGHWGGRYIWQLADSPELLVAWRTVAAPETARAYEVRLLEWFGGLHGDRRPFANLVG